VQADDHFRELGDVADEGVEVGTYCGRARGGIPNCSDVVGRGGSRSTKGNEIFRDICVAAYFFLETGLMAFIPGL
jgi:hypothetical protein